MALSEYSEQELFEELARRFDSIIYARSTRWTTDEDNHNSFIHGNWAACLGLCHRLERHIDDEWDAGIEKGPGDE